MPDVPWSAGGGTVTLHVRLTPKADRDAVDGIVRMADGRSVLAVRVRALPEKGAANTALAALIARRLKVARSSVSLTRGATGRIKTLRIDAADGLLDRLAGLVE